MTDVPSAGWREVYRWLDVPVPMTLGKTGARHVSVMSKETTAPDGATDGIEYEMERDELARRMVQVETRRVEMEVADALTRLRREVREPDETPDHETADDLRQAVVRLREVVEGLEESLEFPVSGGGQGEE